MATLKAVREAAVAEAAAEKALDRADQRWRRAWWATTALLGEFPTGDNRGVEQVMKETGQTRTWVVKRARLGRWVGERERRDFQDLPTRLVMKVVIDEGGTKRSFAEVVAEVNAHAGSSLREASEAITGKPWADTTAANIERQPVEKQAEVAKRLVRNPQVARSLYRDPKAATSIARAERAHMRETGQEQKDAQRKRAPTLVNAYDLLTTLGDMANARRLYTRALDTVKNLELSADAREHVEDELKSMKTVIDWWDSWLGSGATSFDRALQKMLHEEGGA